ncbi:MAG: squalene--hopene cyclase [Planctomycetaceae bacterium]|nr:squalene--hopene cyclase [Planctomycetaceae bacterium]
MDSKAIDPKRIANAYEKARLDLLEQRDGNGHWVGELSTSALSTATAVSALALVERHGEMDAKSGRYQNELLETELSELIVGGIEWLADHQNEDGGWGDTDKSYSNISTTMLAVAAFHLTGVPCKHADLLERAEAYIERQGGIQGLKKRYGKDKTFAVPILANCAMAGIVPWKAVSPLPFELACFPQSFYRFLRMPVVSYAIPALVAIGQARYFHQPPLNPITRFARKLTVSKSLDVLHQMQPESGGYLEAIPLTSFVLMSLASTGRVDHPVAQKAFDFLLSTIRPDGSWPIDTNLATWNTTLSLNALAGAGEDIAERASLDWLLDCQHREVHSFTGAEPGGWGWSDLSGAVPDSDDTPSALLTLAEWIRSPSCSEADQARIKDAALAGVGWLLDLQNGNGGWPTFCRGWGKLPFDRSGSDLTAHALRALHAWRDAFDDDEFVSRYDSAFEKGQQYLLRTQRCDGSWLPLWFGNQDVPEEENPVYGTAKVLMAYRDLGMLETNEAQRGLEWLRSNQNRDDGWGGGASVEKRTGNGIVSSVEETALAVETLLGADAESLQPTVTKGLRWLVETVERGGHTETSPIGFYFAKLWYHEKLYPLIFTVSALGRAVTRLPVKSEGTDAAHLSC